MPRCNAGGGRNNQNNNDPTVPRRSMFSNFGNKGKGNEKGKRDGGKDDKGKGKRPVFESQKEMDKWKGKGKGGGSQAANALPKEDDEAMKNCLWQKTEPPAYLHSTFCLTRDDHLMLEPLLGRSGLKANKPQSLGLDSDIISEATAHLRTLGFTSQRVKTALDVVGSELVLEAEERDAEVTVRAAAERALEWLCCVVEETELPNKLREPRDVTMARKRQEDRNVAFQTKALMLGGDIDPTDIARIEKLGFSRPKAIEAIARAPGNALLPAVKALLAEYLPLDQSECSDGTPPSTQEELMDEAEALRGVYGDDCVQVYQPKGNFELAVQIGADWQLIALLPSGLPYPCTAPILCPKHPRLRDATRPKLLTALGEACRSALGAPMLFTLCEWLRDEGESFLVRTDAGNNGSEGQAEGKRIQSAVERSLEASEQQRQKEDAAKAAKASRVEYLLSLEAKENATSRAKDKIAAEIREDPSSGKQFDLAGYEDDDVQRLVQEAFGEPLEGEKMVRITFVTGGGKTVRNKYAETCTRSLGAALQELGFVQDATAANTWESGGTFKGQHDKERNLKLVHVFPKMVSSTDGAPASRAETREEMRNRVVRGSWSEFVAEVAPWIVQQDMSSNVDDLLQYLDKMSVELQEIGSVLLAGRPISDTQRQLYDELGGPEEVAERAKWVKAEMAARRPQPRAGGTAGAADGKTFEFQAPAELALAGARYPGAEPVSGEDGDYAWLKRRLQQTRSESEALRKRMADDKPLTSVRRGLPAWDVRERIQSAVRDNPVIVIEGDTGCGKSTQVPQFILEDWASRGEAGATSILMTQPRRLSAIGVADRIAAEMDCRLGDLVGYSIRLESKKSAKTKVLVCTTGVVLRRLEADRTLQGVTHIIVDECHERDLDTDFLLTVLRDILPKRPALKVLLMSATVNAQVFCDYFGGCPSVHIPGRTFPVTSYFMEHALMHTSFVVEPDGEYSRKDAQSLSYQEMEELQQMYQKAETKELMKGAVVEQSVLESLNRMDPERINFDLVAAVVQHIHTQLDPPKKGKALGCILIFVPGLAEIKKCIRVISELGTQGVDGMTSGGIWALPLHSMISVVDQRRVFDRASAGQRKVVVTTNIAETSITIDDVEFVIDCGRHKQTRYDSQNRITMLVDCVETKANAKQRRGRAGRVKAGVCYHLVNLRKWKRLEDFERPEIQRVPLDSLCLRISLLGLGHPAKFLARAPTAPSDSAVQASLKQLVELSAVELQQRHLAEEALGQGEWTKEDQEKLMRSKLRLTPLGTHLAQLPVDACIGKLLVLGSLFGIPRDVCTLAAALSSRSPFAASVGAKRGEADKRKLELAAGLESDQLLLVSLYEKWEKLGTGAARSYCRTNGLDNQTLESVKEMRAHLLATLAEQGFLPYKEVEAEHASAMPSCLASIVTAREEFTRRKQQLLRALLCGALWPNVALKKSERLFARQQTSLTFHPSSILSIQEQQAAEAKAGDWNCPACGFFNFASREVCKSCGQDKPLPSGDKKPQELKHGSFMFAEKTQQAPSQGQRPKIMVRDCTGVSTKSLLFFGHHVHVDFLSGRTSVDGWIHCMAAPRDGALLLGLRRRLQEVLMRRLKSLGSSQNTESALGTEDREVVNAVASVLVLDAD